MSIVVALALPALPVLNHDSPLIRFEYSLLVDNLQAVALMGRWSS